MLIADNDNDKFKFYVYAWQYPNGRTFYVGKGCGNRDRAPKHVNNRLFQNIVAKIRRSGEEPRIVRWQDGLHEADALKLEMSYIKLFGRRDISTGVLANLTDGGEGMSGLVVSEETRLKMKEAHSTEEARARSRANAIGNKRCVGREISAETRAKIGDANRGMVRSEEVRRKLSAAVLARSPEEIARFADIGRNPSKETCAKISSASIGRPKSKEMRHKLSAWLRMAPPKDGYKGVSFDSQCGKWRSYITVNSKRRYLGRFDDQISAAKAYDKAAIESLGIGNCYLNLPITGNDNDVQLCLPLAAWPS